MTYAQEQLEYLKWKAEQKPTMNYDNCEHEYAELKAQFHQERMLEPTEPHDGGYLLVDDNQVQEPVGFRSIDGAVEYAKDNHFATDYTVYQLKKVL